MIGLEYLCNLRNMEFKDVANELGISKQAVSQWVKGKTKISKKHYRKLESIFNVSIAYITKELDEIDILNLQKMQLEKDATEFLYNDKVYDEKEDKTVIIKSMYANETEQAEIERMYFNIQKKEMLRDIEEKIDKTAAENEDDYLNENIDEGIKLINMFNDLLSIIENEDLDLRIVQDTLSALKMSQDKKGDDNRFIRQIAAVIMQKRCDIQNKRTKFKRQHEFTKNIDEDLL